MAELLGVVEGEGDRVEVAAHTLQPSRVTFQHQSGGLRQTEVADRVELLVRGVHHVSGGDLPPLNPWLHPLRGLLSWEALRDAVHTLAHPTEWLEVASHLVRGLVESAWARPAAPRAGGWWVVRWNTRGRMHTLVHGVPAVSAQERAGLERSLSSGGLCLFERQGKTLVWRWLEPEIAVRRVLNEAFVRRVSGLVFRVHRPGGLTEEWDLSNRAAGLARWGLGDLAAEVDLEEAGFQALRRYPDAPWTEDGLIEGIGIYLRSRRDEVLKRSRLGTKTHGGFWIDLITSALGPRPAVAGRAAALASVRATLGVWCKDRAASDPPEDSPVRSLLEELADAWRRAPPGKWPSAELLDAWLDPGRLDGSEQGELQSSRLDGALCEVFERRVVPFSETVYMAAVVSGLSWQGFAAKIGFPTPRVPDARELNRYASSRWVFQGGDKSARLMLSLRKQLWPAVSELYRMNGAELEEKIEDWMKGDTVPGYLRNAWRAQRHRAQLQRLLRGGGTVPRGWPQLSRMERIALTAHLGRLYDFHADDAVDPFDHAGGGER